jgi:hypothetical protein
MRLFIVASMGFLLNACCFSQPSIVVRDTLFDFGNLYQGMIKTHTLKIHNTGDQPLKIIQLNAPCYCSTLSMDTDKISPNDSADLRITFDSKSYNGEIIKDVLVVSNDPLQRNRFISFSANVAPVLVYHPSNLFFPSSDTSQNGEQYIWIRNAWDKPIGLEFQTDRNKLLGTAVGNVGIAPGDSARIGIRLLRYCPSDTNGSFTFRTDCGLKNTIEINYFVSGGN